MKKVYCITLLLLYASFGHGQQWSALNSGTTKWLRGVDFPSPDTGYVVGHTATILRTIDAGANWTPLTAGVTGDLNAVFFVSRNVGWACGDGGIILKTTNAGATWIQQSVVSPDLQDVFFVDAFKGFVVGDGGACFKTTDGGNIWDELDLGVSNNKFSAYFMDANNGFVAGSGGMDAIQNSSNGGQTWSSVFDMADQSFGSVVFTNADNGYAASQNSGTIFRTDDAGASWEDAAVNTSGGLYSLAFPSENIGYAVGGFPNSSSIVFTNDAGQTWVNQASAVSNPLFDVYFTNDSVGYAVGMNGSIIKTVSGNVLSAPAINLDELLSIYPNPTNGILNVKSSIPESFTSIGVLRNLSGQIVAVVDLNDSKEIVLDHLPGGMYFLLLNVNGQTVSKKVLKN